MKLSDQIDAYMALRKIKDVAWRAGCVEPYRLPDGTTIDPLGCLFRQADVALREAVWPFGRCVIRHAGGVLMWDASEQRYHLVPIRDAAEIDIPGGDHCCKIGCRRQAEWRIDSADALYTHACAAHVGELLTDAPRHYITPLR